MKKILVVEDDLYLSGAYRTKLEMVGYEVKVAGDGEEALAILRDFVPDLILLDLVMPRKDGFSTLEDLKKSELWKNIPVLVVTNLSQEEEADRAVKMGADDFIVKTETSMEDFVSKVKSILESG